MCNVVLKTTSLLIKQANCTRYWLMQICVVTLMAQVGAWVPADEVVLSPADAIFVRMGAKDHIMMGQSTFFVELSETAAMLSRVTQCVALPDLHTV